MPAAVIFDAAGTLLHLREPVGETYARIAADHGVALSGPRIADAFARIFRAAPPMAFPGEPPSRTPALERAWWRARVRETFRATDATAHFADFDRFFAVLYDAFSDPTSWRLAEGAHDCLAQLRARGLRVGVLSNFDHRLPELLDFHGIAPFLDFCFRPGVSGFAKPAPEAFESVLSHLDLPPGSAVYVGDDVGEDGGAAARAGIRAIDVTTLATLADLPQRMND